MRAALLLLIGLGIAREGHAHEFWVQPNEFQIAPGAVLSLALQVGDGGMRQRSPIPLHRITRFDAIGPNGDAVDVRLSLAATVKRDVVLDVPGTYVLALATDNRAYSRQSAERFNAYLETEGLTPALEHRARTHQMHVDGFERYSRAAKSIVLVGPSGAQSQPHVTKPSGLPLEIVPVVNPYSGATADQLSGESPLQRPRPGRCARKAHQPRTGSRASGRATQRHHGTSNVPDASDRQLAGERGLDEAPGELVRGGLRDDLREPDVRLRKKVSRFPCAFRVTSL